MKEAPKSVSGRVVKISTRSPGPAGSNHMRSPAERPIHFSCITRTFSGQRSIEASASRSSSA
jgi:hypothetical protein